ncbi:unnamed protein product [Ectocarpus sp. 8 AP-2014]
MDGVYVKTPHEAFVEHSEPRHGFSRYRHGVGEDAPFGVKEAARTAAVQLGHPLTGVGGIIRARRNTRACAKRGRDSGYRPLGFRTAPHVLLQDRCGVVY